MTYRTYINDTDTLPARGPSLRLVWLLFQESAHAEPLRGRTIL